MSETVQYPSPRRLRRLSQACMLAAAMSAFAGCSSSRQESSGLFSPYRIDLPQGNYVTREMLDQVQRGMSREQVRAALGSPLLVQVFRNDRWDYVFRYQLPNGQAEQRRVLVRFKDDRVDTIEADELPLREDSSDPALPGAKAARAREAKAAARQSAVAAEPKKKEDSQ